MSTRQEAIPQDLNGLGRELEQALIGLKPDIEHIRALVKGVEGFTSVTSPDVHHEADAAGTRLAAIQMLKNPRLRELGITTDEN